MTDEHARRLPHVSKMQRDAVGLWLAASIGFFLLLTFDRGLDQGLDAGLLAFGVLSIPCVPLILLGSSNEKYERIGEVCVNALVVLVVISPVALAVRGYYINPEHPGWGMALIVSVLATIVLGLVFMSLKAEENHAE